MHHYECGLLGRISARILEATKCVCFMLRVMGVWILKATKCVGGARVYIYIYGLWTYQVLDGAKQIDTCI